MDNKQCYRGVVGLVGYGRGDVLHSTSLFTKSVVVSPAARANQATPRFRHHVTPIRCASATSLMYSVQDVQPGLSRKSSIDSCKAQLLIISLRQFSPTMSTVLSPDPQIVWFLWHRQMLCQRKGPDIQGHEHVLNIISILSR